MRRVAPILLIAAAGVRAGSGPSPLDLTQPASQSPRPTTRPVITDSRKADSPTRRYLRRSNPVWILGSDGGSAEFEIVELSSEWLAVNPVDTDAPRTLVPPHNGPNQQPIPVDAHPALLSTWDHNGSKCYMRTAALIEGHDQPVGITRGLVYRLPQPTQQVISTIVRIRPGTPEPE